MIAALLIAQYERVDPIITRPDPFVTLMQLFIGLLLWIVTMYVFYRLVRAAVRDGTVLAIKAMRSLPVTVMGTAGSKTPTMPNNVLIPHDVRPRKAPPRYVIRPGGYTGAKDINFADSSSRVSQIDREIDGTA